MVSSFAEVRYHADTSQHVMSICSAAVGVHCQLTCTMHTDVCHCCCCFLQGAWATWNYINDRFYTMLPSQLFFQLTELLPAYLIYQLLDRSNYKDLQPLGPLLGLAVSCVHISLALKERVLWGLFIPGVHTVNARDVMLVAGDMSCLVFFWQLLYQFRLRRQERVQLVLWGLAVAGVMLVVYVAALGYRYQ